jgi:hypothetical protein
MGAADHDQAVESFLILFVSPLFPGDGLEIYAAFNC